MLTAALKLRKADDIHTIQVLIRSFLNRLDKYWYVVPGPALNSGAYILACRSYFLYLVLRKIMAIAVVTIPIIKAPAAPCFA